MADQFGNKASSSPIGEQKDVDRLLINLLDEHKEDSDFWSSKARDRTDSAHCLFQYPAMMVPVVQRRLLQVLLEAQPNINSLYDPFVGSGTSLVAGMSFGLNTFGNDINPLAILISRVRTSQSINLNIDQACKDVARIAREDKLSTIETDMKAVEKWFKPEVARELSSLRRVIRRFDDLWIRRFLWVTLAETVRLTSNDRTSTYKLHTRAAPEIERRVLSPISMFREIGERSIKSLLAFRHSLGENNLLKKGRYVSETHVQLADIRTDLSQDWNQQKPFDLLMTSPPYGDNRTTVTYGQHSYLPLNWIDFADIDPRVDLGALRSTAEIDARSLGGRLRKIPDALDALFEASPSLKKISEKLPLAPNDARTRLLSFYADFSESLNSISSLLATNAYMVWTVGNRSLAGNLVPTDEILGELLEARGCAILTCLSRQIHHKRMPSRNDSTSTMREEKIVVARSNGAELSQSDLIVERFRKLRNSRNYLYPR